MNKHYVTVNVATRHTFVIEMPDGDAFAQAAEAEREARKLWDASVPAKKVTHSAPSVRWEFATSRDRVRKDD